MCGIAGLYYPGLPKPIEPARLAAMTNALAHRGPDGSGIWTAPGVGLGHRRLSIIDVAGSSQPMATPGETHVVVFNGEIYNYQEIRAELIDLGARFGRFGLGRAAALLLPRRLEQRILLDLIGDERLDLQIRQRQQLDRLLKLRRHHQ